VTGAIRDVELKRAEDRAVDDAVRLQTRGGASVVTDGEMRRYAYLGHFIDSIDGFDKFGGWAIPFRDDQGNELLFQRAAVVSRLLRPRRSGGDRCGSAVQSARLPRPRCRSGFPSYADRCQYGPWLAPFSLRH